MEPYWQGSLDGLCGIYSIINAVRIVVGGISAEKCYRLFFKILTALEEKHSLPYVVSSGVEINGLAHIFKTVIEKEYPVVKRSKPFHRRRDASLDEVWERMQDFLSMPNRSVLIGLDN